MNNLTKKIIISIFITIVISIVCISFNNLYLPFILVILNILFIYFQIKNNKKIDNYDYHYDMNNTNEENNYYNINNQQQYSNIDYSINNQNYNNSFYGQNEIQNNNSLMTNDIDRELKEQERLLEEVKKQYLNPTQSNSDKKAIYKESKKQINTQIPNIEFIANTNMLYITNENRKHYFFQLNEYLKGYNLSYDSLYKILEPFRETLTSIKKTNNQLNKKLHMNVLEDLSLSDKIGNALYVLDDYEGYLIETGDMYNSEFNIIESGMKGEDDVNNELNNYKNILINMPNVRFEVDGISVESDNLVISPFGVFIIEVKNYSDRYRIKVEKNGEWKKMLSGFEEPMPNVTTQIKRHITCKEKVINNELIAYGYHKIEIKPIIVIANENIDVINLSKIPVLKTYKLYDYISKQPTELDPKTMTMIRNIVQKNNLPPKAYQIEDIRKYVLSLIAYLNKNLSYYQYLDSQLKHLNDKLK